MANNILDLSDDEISNMSEPPEDQGEHSSSGSSDEPETPENEATEAQDDDSTTDTEDEDDASGEPSNAAGSDADDDGSDDPDDSDDGNVNGDNDSDDDSGEGILNAADDAVTEPKKPNSKLSKNSDKNNESTDTGNKEKSSEEKDKKESEKVIDYKAEYEKIMAPIKANGKIITLDNPDEVIKLMQMGANYTKKMQALQPHIKLVKMLEKNSIDEDKLNLLIDLDKKDPEAIRKFLQDNSIDPMDIDTTVDANYKAGNHKISDGEIQFQDVINEVTASQKGQELVVHIHREWDQASKDAIFQDAGILQVLNEQKQNGIYDQIASEVDKQRTLGNLTNLPFIHAYKVVGDAMAKNGLLGNISNSDGNKKVEPENKPVLARQIRPSKTVVNSDKAKAASPTRGSPPKKVAEEFNPLNMKDEDFLKQMENRV